MKYNPIIVILICLSNHLSAQNDYRIISYNVENFFDTYNNPQKEDDPFTPQGFKHWNNNRYKNKLLNIGRVLATLSSECPVPFIALQEIENQYVLNDLIQKTALANYQLSYIHNESPDKRGIDVALLYNPRYFQPIETRYYNPAQQISHSFYTRDILYCKGLLLPSDTIHVLVCHLPSRIDGKIITQQKQSVITRHITFLCDSIAKSSTIPYIIVLGDFNMTFNTPWMKTFPHLNLDKTSVLQPTKLFNGYAGKEKYYSGSYKYKGKWEIIDHILLSTHFVTESKNKLRISSHTQICTIENLLIEDRKYYGKKPFSTYNGWIYQGGFSDHLPIYIHFSRYNSLKSATFK